VTIYTSKAKVPEEVNVCTTYPGLETVLIVPPVALATVPG
jgi:hypothetical protein